MVTGLDDVMGAGMERRQHVRQPVEVGEVIKGRAAADILQIPQVGCARHRHEHRVLPAEGQVVGGIPGVVGKAFGDAGDQFAHETPVEENGLVHHLRPGAAPVLQRDGVAEDDPDIFQEFHRGGIDPQDFLLVHRFHQRKAALQRGQHRGVTDLADGLAGVAPAAGGFLERGHPTVSPSLGSVRSIQIVLNSVYWSWAWTPLSRPPNPDCP